MPEPVSLVSAVAFRGISGIRPLWRRPNEVGGRFNLPGRRPTQYLCLHPLGPMAELIRHQPLAGAFPGQVTRNVFAVRVHAPLLTVSFASAATVGIDPSELVGDAHGPCQAWVEELLERRPGLVGLRVPSAALPGTENVVLFGAATPISYLAAPRRSGYLPCAVLALDGHPPADLPESVHPAGTSRTHPELAAWQQVRQPGHPG